MMSVVIATGNKNKLAEIKTILGNVNLDFKCLGDFPNIGEIKEDGDTIEANAVKKAKTAAFKTGLWSLADDTGLEVDYLNGAPGVFSARYAGPQCSYSANNTKLLRELKEAPDELRKAVFKCVMALASPSGEIVTVKGILRGRIIRSSRGKNGFGYDPIFLVEEVKKTMAELSVAEKNLLSHRARALKKMVPYLLELGKRR